ncbi:MAG: glycosyltransferase [Alphaproteobacteria bacterium]
MMHVFIGYDGREDLAYRVCRFSIVNRASAPVAIHQVTHKAIRHMGLFDRPWRIDGPTGQMIDERDGKPFSTEFAHTRFLVPHLARRLGLDTGWALFCDCDFLFLADPAELFALTERNYAVMCVKHRHASPEGTKMDRVAQSRYARKNWSSLVLWNLEKNGNLALDDVNHRTGGWLHAFSWLADGEIGALPEAWNWLAGVSPTTSDAVGETFAPKAVHFTEGGPWFPQYRGVPYAMEWLQELAAMHHPRPSLARDAGG